MRSINCDGDHSFYAILIRAPVWGAMRKERASTLALNILIRAPVWGAIFARFGGSVAQAILIRAPVWGAI